jgi:hypothetical protein
MCWRVGRARFGALKWREGTGEGVAKCCSAGMARFGEEGHWRVPLGEERYWGEGGQSRSLFIHQTLMGARDGK